MNIEIHVFIALSIVLLIDYNCINFLKAHMYHRQTVYMYKIYMLC